MQLPHAPPKNEMSPLPQETNRRQPKPNTSTFSIDRWNSVTIISLFQRTLPSQIGIKLLWYMHKEVNVHEPKSPYLVVYADKKAR